jgi:hypothetical protein
MFMFYFNYSYINAANHRTKHRDLFFCYFSVAFIPRVEPLNHFVKLLWAKKIFQMDAKQIVTALNIFVLLSIHLLPKRK